MVIFIQGDNGSSAEGGHGLLNEMTFFNAIPEPLDDEAAPLWTSWAGRCIYNHFPVGWAHAMDTPFQWTKQVASHFGGTRNGLVISWPQADQGHGRDPQPVPPRDRHRADDSGSRRHQMPAMLNGVAQKPIEGVSMAYTFDDANAPDRRTHAILRDARQPGHLPRRLDGERHSRRTVGEPQIRLAITEHAMGAVPRRTKISARPTICRARSPKSSRSW